MPETLVLITGTGTEVGKTWLTASIAKRIRASGVEVTARKPVMSFDASDDTNDAQILAAATGEDETIVCPAHRRYELAMAPPMAADSLGRPPFGIDELVGELDLPQSGAALVEGVGGVRSPLAHDGDTISLARRLDPDYVVVVGPSGLGAINDVLTTREALGGEWPLIVFLNRFDPGDTIHRGNLAWLRDQENLPLAVTPERVARCILNPRPNTLGTHNRKVEVQ